jgi:hypothetical protein
MSAAASPSDLVQLIDVAKGHVINRVICWPDRWKLFTPPPGITWNWQSVPFDKSSSSAVPNDQHGLYSFILSPGVASHPRNHLVLYIGKADKMTLRERFHSYFRDMRRVSRPAITYVLTKYFGYLEFCFTPVAQSVDIDPGEGSLLSALIPPYNTDFPGEVSEVIRGLR